MSLKVLNWAFEEPIQSAACKFVLVALADYANDMSHAYPSVQTVCRKTSLERKTVILCLDKLVRSGHLRDTGRRMGGTNSIPVYEILVEQSQNRNYSVFDRSYSENGTTKLSQKRDTEPLSSLTVREPIGFFCENQESAPRVKKSPEPVSIPKELSERPEFEHYWGEFKKHRREKDKKGATPMAEKMLLKKLAERPEHAVFALKTTICRNWTSFEWAWIKDLLPKLEPVSFL